MSRPPIVADLHTHSQISDGEFPPEQIVDLAAVAGLQTLALTDHDTVAGVERARARGKERGIEVIAGVELTAYEGEIELHILALLVDVSPQSSFPAFLENLQRARRDRALQSAAQLRTAGYDISDADVLDAAGGALSIGRPHVALALVRRGHARNLQSALAKFLREGQPGFVPKFKLTPEQACAAAHAAGGVAILAHPGSEPHDELIAPLFRRGLDGVEAWAAAHSEANRRFYAGLARRYEKLISGGSDFHGPRLKPGVEIGAGGVDRATLAQLRRTAEREKGRTGEGEQQQNAEQPFSSG